MKSSLELAALAVALGANFARVALPWTRRWRVLLYAGGQLGALLIALVGASSAVDSLAVGICVVMLATVLGVLLRPLIATRLQVFACGLLVTGLTIALSECWR